MEDIENLQVLINKKFINPVKDLNLQVLKTEDEITTFILNEVLDKKINNERMLLNFRRVLERIINVPLFVTTISKSTNKIIAVRNDNFLQLLDDRYYTSLQLSSFLDIFKIETNNYNNLIMVGEKPHIKLVINYIMSHYNTTFRKFMNRNKEYYYMYKFFFDNAENIKEILDILNSYHYSEDKESNLIYNNTNFDIVRIKITTIYNSLLEVFDKIWKKVSN